MKAIDRVMRAYLNTRKLTEDEALRVRAELSKFIDELMSGKLMSGKTMSGKTMSGKTMSGKTMRAPPTSSDA